MQTTDDPGPAARLRADVSALLDVLEPRRLVFSTYGLREGVVFEGFDDDDWRREDPLLAACALAARRAELEGSAG